jgi:hypothetical protein
VDFSTLPTGQQGWHQLVTALSKTDDRVERHFLELKSDIDLNATAGRVKVAKFILGAANRDPERAKDYFGGHGLMILGVARGALPGVPGFETHELTREVRKYTGTPGPAWDYVRIGTEDDNDVIAVVVSPPQPGRIWPCLREAEGLRNGILYLRADGETRPATGDEVNAMVARVAEGSGGLADFEVSIVGGAHHVHLDGDPGPEPYIDAHRDRLIEAWEKRYRGPRMPGSQRYTRYLRDIEQWSDEVRARWPTLGAYLASTLGETSHVRVANLSDTFAEDVLVTVRLAGNAVVTPANRSGVARILAHLPEPPNPYGKYSYYKEPLPFVLPVNELDDVRGPRSEGEFDDGSSTALSLRLGELRPRAAQNGPSGDFALLVRDPGSVPEQISGTWEITARGHHRVYRGELVVPVVREVVDAGNLLARMLSTSDELYDSDD